MWHRLFYLIIFLTAFDVEAKTLRSLWVPEATSPDYGICRFETENQFVPIQKSSATPQYDYLMSIGCHSYRFWKLDFEVGGDYEHANDIVASSLLDPLQAFGKMVYTHSPDSAIKVAAGIDGYGLKSGQNDFQLMFLTVDSRVDSWGINIGAYQGMTSTLRSFDGEKSKAGAMASIRRFVGHTVLGLDWFSGKNRYGYIALGSNYQITQGFSFTTMLMLANDRSLQSDTFLLRLSFSQ